MAVSLLAHEVSDLCLAKPPLKSLPLSASISDALSALKSSDDSFLSVWTCDHSSKTCSGSPVPGRDDPDSGGGCRCVGKVCMVDVICYLCKDENLMSPSDALKAPLSAILPVVDSGLVAHVEPSTSLLEAIDLILQGAQNLVVPIKTRLGSTSRRKQYLQKLTAASVVNTIHDCGREFCWLTQEDLVRFLLNSIGLFSPTASLSIDALRIITADTLTIDYHSPASAAIPLISRSLSEQTSVAVVDGDGVLIGELSPFTLSCRDETVAAAAATLSAGDLMAYIDCGGPPDELVRVVMGRLKERSLEAMLREIYNPFTAAYSSCCPFSSCSSFSLSSSSASSSSSSDEECANTPVTTLRRSGKYSRSMSYSARMARRAEAIVCHPKSSLVAVMIQAVTHRVNYVWVVEDDCSLVGIVTFLDMLRVFRENLEEMV